MFIMMGVVSLSHVGAVGLYLYYWFYGYLGFVIVYFEVQAGGFGASRCKAFARGSMLWLRCCRFQPFASRPQHLLSVASVIYLSFLTVSLVPMLIGQFIIVHAFDLSFLH